MATEHLPRLVTPTNKDEFDELNAYVQEVTNEMYVKLQIIAAETNHRLRNPKSNSKTAQALAWARLDLRAYSRAVTRPMANAGGAAIAVGKAFRLAHTRFYDIYRTARGKGGRSGFDF